MAYEQQSHIITLNQSDIVPDSGNSRFVYTFPQPTEFGPHARIAFSKYIGYNSIFNITTALNNNTFSFVWYDAGGAMAPITVTVPDGSYSVAQLNSYLQSIMVANNMYLINGAGNYIYYLEIVVNATQYTLQINSYPIPTALPGGYTAPVGWPGYPLVATTPQFVVAANNFRTWSGFEAGTYPPVVQAVNYSALSTSAPQVDPTPTMAVRCNLANNLLSLPSDIIYQIAVQGDFGTQYIVEPPKFSFASVRPGRYENLIISLTNAATGGPITLQDPQQQILLVIYM